MDYAVHTMPSYQHLQDSASPSHLGSKNSSPHLAGGDAGYKNAMEHNPGGATQSKIVKGSPTKLDNMGSHKETKGPGGMDM